MDKNIFKEIYFFKIYKNLTDDGFYFIDFH